ncbi:MAG: SDR family NAD(P)-dependent oxidoreductase [Gammaproteobacteria bacterium]
MRIDADTVAVITGAASGIGRALAEAAQWRGARLVLADIRADALAATVTQLSDRGEVLGVPTDVSSAADMEALASAAIARFGAVNLLVNNAGVFASGLAWTVSDAEYDWVIGVNQRSVAHGIRAFVPRMIARQAPAHVVTIASGAGITVNPGFASYSMTKHAVVALTEALYLDLAAEGIDHVGVTIAMPGMSRSDIMNPEKASPSYLKPSLRARLAHPRLDQLERLMRAGVDAGLPVEELARTVLDAVVADALYVLPGFSDAASRTFAEAVGHGRATGSNPYPRFMPARSAGGAGFTPDGIG